MFGGAKNESVIGETATRLAKIASGGNVKLCLLVDWSLFFIFFKIIGFKLTVKPFYNMLFFCLHYSNDLATLPAVFLCSKIVISWKCFVFLSGCTQLSSFWGTFELLLIERVFVVA